MKKILSIIALFLVLSSSFSLKAQDSNQLNSFVISSLKSYISHDNNLRKDLGWAARDYHYICSDGIPNDDGFPYDSLQNVIYCSLKNVDGLPSKFKKQLKKGLFFMFVDIKLSKNKLVITVSGNIVKLIKKKELNIALSDWGIFTYEYSCNNQEWELIDSRFGGV